MASRLTAQLKWLNEFINKIMTHAEDNSTKPNNADEYQRMFRKFAAIAEGELSTFCHRLLKRLQNEIKTNKCIDELHLLKNRRKDVDDKDTVQFFRNISAPHQVTVKEGASNVEENNVESFRDISAHIQGLVEEGSCKDEENKTEYFLDVPVPPQGPVEKGIRKDEENNTESFQDIPVPPQASVKAGTSKGKDNFVEPLFYIQLPPRRPVKADASYVEDNDAEPSMKSFLESFRNLKANASQYKSTKFSHGCSLLFQVPEDASERHEPFRVLMDVSNFSPKEIKVEIPKRYFVVHGKHEMVLENHGEVSREFTRKFEIPDDVDIETFIALIDCYGVLTVQASRKPANS